MDVEVGIKVIDLYHEIEWLVWAHAVTMEDFERRGHDYDYLNGWTIYPTMLNTMWREKNKLGLVTFARVGMLGGME